MKMPEIKAGDFPGDSVVKTLPASAEAAGDWGSIPASGIPLEKEMATHSSILFLLGEFHGQRSLAGYSPWGNKESDTTE